MHFLLCYRGILNFRLSKFESPDVFRNITVMPSSLYLSSKAYVGTHGGSRTHKETCVLSAAHMPILLRGYMDRFLVIVLNLSILSDTRLRKHSLLAHKVGFEPTGPCGHIRFQVCAVITNFGTCAYLFNWCERYGHYPYLTLEDTCAPNLLRVPQLQCGRL